MKNGHCENSHISLGWCPSSRRWKSKASGLEFPNDSSMKYKQILATNITLKYHLVAPHPDKKQDFQKGRHSSDMFTSNINIYLVGKKSARCTSFDNQERCPNKVVQQLQTGYILLGCPWYGT